LNLDPLAGTPAIHASEVSNGGLSLLLMGDLLQAPGEVFVNAADIPLAGQAAQVFNLRGAEFDVDPARVDIALSGASVSLPTPPLSELLELHAA
jgi:hypothetical protein